MKGVAAIVSLKNLELVNEGDFAMCLTHIALGEEKYCEFYKNYNKPKLLDNSYFELGYALSLREVVKAARKIDANVIVMKDGTLEGLESLLDEGFQVMAVPTTEAQFKDFIVNEKVSKIGVSCLHIPAIVGREKFAPVRGAFVASCLKELNAVHLKEKVHFLGSTNNVLQDIKDAEGLVNSIDTSLPFFAALEGVSGVDKRVDKEFSFYDERVATTIQKALFVQNLNYLKELV